MFDKMVFDTSLIKTQYICCTLWKHGTMLQKPNFLLKLKVKLITMEIIQVMFLRLLSSIQTCFLHPKVILTVCFNDHIILHVYLHSFTKKNNGQNCKITKKHVSIGSLGKFKFIKKLLHHRVSPCELVVAEE